MRVAICGSTNGASRASGSSATRNNRGYSFGKRFADRIGMSRRPNCGCIYTRSTAVVGNRSDDHVEILFPIVDAIFADDHFAVTGSMNLDAWIVGPNGRGGTIAEEKRAAAVAQDLARACVG